MTYKKGTNSPEHGEDYYPMGYGPNWEPIEELSKAKLIDLCKKAFGGEEDDDEEEVYAHVDYSPFPGEKLIEALRRGDPDILFPEMSLWFYDELEPLEKQPKSKLVELCEKSFGKPLGIDYSQHSNEELIEVLRNREVGRLTPGWEEGHRFCCYGPHWEPIEELSKEKLLYLHGYFYGRTMFVDYSHHPRELLIKALREGTPEILEPKLPEGALI